MTDWTRALLPEGSTILETMRNLDQSQMQLALVVDEDQHLLGVVSDGDIRRSILKGVSMETPVSNIMSRTYLAAKDTDSDKDILDLMKKRGINPVPVTDKDGKVVDLKLLREMIKPVSLPNWAVVMAGGFGTRLHPITENCPKPLLKVGNKPLLETILSNLREHGINTAYLSLHYKADMITRHLGDGSDLDMGIKYIFEDIPLGTAGALKLLPETPDEPILVMNGDLLTKLDFNQLIQFHKDSGAMATMCVRKHEFTLPYGVVDMDEHRLLDIREKPQLDYFINAGIYVLNPEVLQVIPENEYFGMDSLFKQLIAKKHEVATFPIHEYWLDIGRMPDYELANSQYHEVFCAPAEQEGA